MPRELDSDLRALYPDEPDLYLPEVAPEEPPELRDGPAWNRRLLVCDQPSVGALEFVSLDCGRAMIANELRAYGETKDPGFVLAVIAAPGSGKTRGTVRQAERWAMDGRRILYAAPRHDFYADVLALADHPSMWFEWQPRTEGDKARGVARTCRHTAAISKWLAKGHDAMKFCSGVCGWDYVNGGCVWHEQKRLAGRIVFGQHQHLTAGHPLDFDIAIVDESPIAAFMREWVIPAQWITPRGMRPEEPITEILDRMQSMAGRGVSEFGRSLIEALGGAERVLAATELVKADAKAMLSPSIYQPEDADRADYLHLPVVAQLLNREARAALEGRDYPHRVIVTNKNLLLLLRYPVNEKMPPHVVVLDATGNQRLLETIFRRPVKMVAPKIAPKGRIFQVYDRANGVGSLLGKEDGAPSKISELAAQIDEISGRYQRPAVITHAAMERHLPGRWTGHYFAERGTNRFQDVDALIIAGVPLPPHHEIVKMASMLFFERMEPFGTNGAPPWSVVAKPFRYQDGDGKGRAYPAPGFWGDPDLQAVLWQLREAELIQAAHRSRLNLRDVDVWLLENLPVDELPPAQLLSIRELLRAPAGVDAFEWSTVLWIAQGYLDAFATDGRPLRSSDLVAALTISKPTAIKYLGKLVETGAWKWPEDDPEIVPVRGRGRPPKAIVPAALGVA